MTFLRNISQRIVNQQYARLFYFFTISFAFLYHTTYLFIFHFLKIEPMFYFNIFSVLFYLTLLITYKYIRIYVFPVILFLIEVIVHQILAGYYLGGDACFHYLILLSGIVPLLTFESRIALASFCGFTTTLIFAHMEANAINLAPQLSIAENTLYVIRVSNVICVSLIEIGTLLCYSYIVWHNKYSLEAKIRQKELIVAKQNKKMFDYQNNIIISLANLVENRDTDTGEHIRRTSAYVELISREALKHKIYPNVINEKFIKRIVHAAPLHDVGKILVSDSILKKPGRLTPEEFEMIKIHTKEGGRIIAEIIGHNDDKDFVKIAKEIATYHHERWDGGGYPKGLKEDKIPVSARIMAIADVFDALISPRCYKSSFTREKALSIIKEESGTHFDPVLAEIFIAIQQDFTNK